jgi:hypothetical protein
VGQNRKRDAGHTRLGPALKAVLICLLLGGSAVGYVLQKNKLYELGRQITKREAILEGLKRENKVRAMQLANLQLPQRIEERVRLQNLGLAQAPSLQMIWLPEPTAEQATNEPSPLVVLDDALDQ